MAQRRYLHLTNENMLIEELQECAERAKVKLAIYYIASSIRSNWLLYDCTLKGKDDHAAYLESLFRYIVSRWIYNERILVHCQYKEALRLCL